MVERTGGMPRAQTIHGDPRDGFVMQICIWNMIYRISLNLHTDVVFAVVFAMRLQVVVICEWSIHLFFLLLSPFRLEMAFSCLHLWRTHQTKIIWNKNCAKCLREFNFLNAKRTPDALNIPRHWPRAKTVIICTTFDREDGSRVTFLFNIYLRTPTY